MIGKYKVKKLLGKGGTAKVYLGYDDEESRYVALKILKPAYVENKFDSI
jgi:serine/threonine protein kinase